MIGRIVEEWACVPDPFVMSGERLICVPGGELAYFPPVRDDDDRR